MKLSVVILAVVAALPFAVGCTADGAGDDVVSEAEFKAANVVPGDFKLYDEPNAKPSASCDVHTSLSLTADGTSKAHLKEVVSGFCHLAVSPNPRDYSLRHTGASCGSHTFTGSFTQGAEKWSITITDHRTRTCMDMMAAQIIVEESSTGGPKGTSTTKYSFDGQQGDVQGNNQGGPSVEAGTFKLYDEPNAKPNPNCDLYTSLALTADGGSKAHLEEAVDGACAMNVRLDANQRDYKLDVADAGCGSRKYTGSYIKDGGQKWSVTITDHRKRVCFDLVPGRIVVEETHDGAGAPQTTKKYSLDK